MIDPELWDADEIVIFESYRYRCIRCQRPAVTLHELVPKSNNPKGWKKKGNRVPICNGCHTWAHDIGTKVSAPILIQCQEDYARW